MSRIDELEKEMKPMQILFCREYVIDWDGKRAALKAGYSAHTAAQLAFNNLKKPKIQEYLKEIMKDLGRVSGVSALRNIEELKKIAYSNIHNYKTNWMTMKDWELVSDDDKAAVAEIQHITHGKKHSVKFKLHDKQKAIELLNKMLGLNAPDKVQVSTDIGLTDEKSRLERIETLLQKVKKK